MLMVLNHLSFSESVPSHTVHEQLVVKDPFLYVRRQVVERHRVALILDGVVAIDVLHQADRPLLTIQHLIRVVAGLCPVHDVQRQPLEHGCRSPRHVLASLYTNSR